MLYLVEISFVLDMINRFSWEYSWQNYFLDY